MTRRWHVEIVVMVEADEPHADLRASDSANLLAQGVGGYVNVMREMSAPEPERMYTCPECSRTFDGPLAANVHEDATGHVPVGAA